MMHRCFQLQHEKYPKYGGVGITVCERWRSFENFLADMGLRPEGKTLDRINNAGNYEPANCRWATPKEQSANRRSTPNQNTSKTHCVRGHEFVGDNLHTLSNGYRVCRTCSNLRARAYRAQGVQR